MKTYIVNAVAGETASVQVVIGTEAEAIVAVNMLLKDLVDGGYCDGRLSYAVFDADKKKTLMKGSGNIDMPKLPKEDDRKKWLVKALCKAAQGG